MNKEKLETARAEVVIVMALLELLKDATEFNDQWGTHHLAKILHKKTVLISELLSLLA